MQYSLRTGALHSENDEVHRISFAYVYANRALFGMGAEGGSDIILQILAEEFADEICRRDLQMRIGKRLCAMLREFCRRGLQMSFAIG